MDGTKIKMKIIRRIDILRERIDQKSGSSIALRITKIGFAEV
jgi:hypothetical protein